MCYRLIEQYSHCGCPYFIHEIDVCADYNTPGHVVENRIILVGYACSEHDHLGSSSKRRPEGGDDGDAMQTDSTQVVSISDGHDFDSDTEDSVLSDTGSVQSMASSATSVDENAVEAVFHGLLQHPKLTHLWPQVVRRTRSRARSLRTLERFLRRYAQDLLVLAMNSVDPVADATNELTTETRGYSVSRVRVDVSQFVSRSRFNVARRIFEAYSKVYMPAETGGWSENKTDLAGINRNGDCDGVDDGEGEYDGDEYGCGNDENMLNFPLDVAEVFLFETGPIQALENSVRMFLEAPLRPKALSNACMNFARIFLENILDSIYRPPVAESKTRITWTCKCGRKLYDDFTELQPGAVQKLEEELRLAQRQWKEVILSEDGLDVSLSSTYRRLQSISEAAQFLRQGMREMSVIYSPFRRLSLPFRNSQSSWPWGRSGRSNTATATGEGTEATGLPQYTRPPQTGHQAVANPTGDDVDGLELGRCSNRGPSLNQANNQNNHHHLLLCVPFLRWATTLAQPEVCRIYSDRDMFHILRNSYRASRGGKGISRSWRTLRRVQGIHFVKFELYSSQLVDVRQNPSVPPISRNSSDVSEYTYEPVPVDVLPPVGSNHLMHLFEHPDHAEVCPVLFRKIPKRLLGRLETSGSTTAVGWGLNFVEGKNWLAILAYGCLGFAVALLVALIWALARSDVQGGFAIAGYMISLLVFCFGVASADTRV